jgi:hypothetical protein
MSLIGNIREDGLRPRDSKVKMEQLLGGIGKNFNKRSAKYEDFLETTSKSISKINLYGKNATRGTPDIRPPTISGAKPAIDPTEPLKNDVLANSMPVKNFKRYQTARDLISIEFPPITTAKPKLDRSQQIFTNPGRPELPAPSETSENKMFQELSKKIYEIEAIYWLSVKRRPKTQRFTSIWKDLTAFKAKFNQKSNLFTNFHSSPKLQSIFNRATDDLKKNLTSWKAELQTLFRNYEQYESSLEQGYSKD